MLRQDCVLGGSSFLLVSGPRTKANQGVYLTDVRKKNGLYVGQSKEEPTPPVATERGEVAIHLLFINSVPCLLVRTPFSQHFLVEASCTSTQSHVFRLLVLFATRSPCNVQVPLHDGG